jgi:hypothetical protein
MTSANSQDFLIGAPPAVLSAEAIRASEAIHNLILIRKPVPRELRIRYYTLQGKDRAMAERIVDAEGEPLPHRRARVAWPSSLTHTDVASIRSLVRAVPDIDHRIIDVQPIGKGKLEIRTGRIYHPEAGKGNGLIVVKRRGRWAIKADSIIIWIA